MFCACPNLYGAPPNTLVCPVCLGHPGALPVFNKQVVDFAILASLALNADINLESKFDRKQYFYPDLPKGYQISQYDIPLSSNGWIEILIQDPVKKQWTPKIIGIERIHIEEDAGKSMYSNEGDSGRLSGSEGSLIDFNRAGVPLLEIVSKPDLRSGIEAAAYGAELRRIVRYLGISDGNMDEGSMRCDVNVSVAPRNSNNLGTKVEIKNMNSFSFIAKAIDYEFQRQSQLIQQGREEEIVQETRLWDESKSQTYTMRTKEGLADYRYFPEPDLPPLILDESWIQTLSTERHELPQERRKRLTELGLGLEDVLVLTDDVESGDYFDLVMKNSKRDSAKAVANWIMGDVTAYCKMEKLSFSELQMRPEALAEMIQLIEEGVISGKIGKQILPALVQGEGNDGVKALIEKKSLIQISNPEEISSIVDQVLEENPKQLEAFRSGKDKLFGFFVGQVMKASKGKANPSIVNNVLNEKLNLHKRTLYLMSQSLFGGLFLRRQEATDASDMRVVSELEGINETDDYGFKLRLRKKDVEERIKCQQKAQRRAQRLVKMLKFPSSTGIRWMRFELERKLPPDKTQLKLMIRKGVPTALRPWIWMKTSGADEKMKKLGGIKYYRRMLEQARESSPVAKQIELDVPRTFPGHLWLETYEGQRLVENILLAYSMHNPRVGYCQSMNYIAALLLLIMGRREDRTFFMMVTLIEDILYEGMYEPTLVGCQTEMRSLEELLGRKLPRLYHLFNSMHCEISMIATDWFLCLYSTSVSAEVTARIWDCLFNEGPKIIFRVSVALLKMAEQHLLRIDNPGEMLKAVKIYASNIHNRDKLMKIAFDGIGSLSMSTIDRLRIMKRQEVDALINARATKENKTQRQEQSRWDELDLEESIALGSDGKSSIATAMSGFSISWKRLPGRVQDLEFE
eukprot:g7812.t1